MLERTPPAFQDTTDPGLDVKPLVSEEPCFSFPFISPLHPLPKGAGGGGGKGEGDQRDGHGVPCEILLS